MVTAIRVSGSVLETWLNSFWRGYLFIRFFQILPITDAAELDGAEGCLQLVMWFAGWKFQKYNKFSCLLKDVEPMQSKSKLYVLSYVLSL